MDNLIQQNLDFGESTDSSTVACNLPSRAGNCFHRGFLLSNEKKAHAAYNSLTNLRQTIVCSCGSF